jgi:hypothetical protein
VRALLIVGLSWIPVSGPRVLIAQQTPVVASGSGRVFGTTSAAAARLVVTPSPLTIAVLDAGSGPADRSFVMASGTGTVPITHATSLVLNAAYGGAMHAAAAAVRLEHETGSGIGLWVGVRAGPVRVDSLGLDPWSRGVASFALPVRGPLVGGPLGLGAGLWGERWGVTFGASVTTGTAGVESQHVSQRFVPDSASPPVGDSLSPGGQWISDTATTSRTAMAWLGRLSAQWTRSRFTVDVSGGVVAQPNAPTAGWVGATLAVQVFSPVALVVAAGTRGASTLVAVDPRNERSYVTGGLSVGWPAALSARRRVADKGDAAAGVVRYRLVPTADSGYTLVIRAPWASSVDVMGDMTGWQAVACDAVHGREWRLPNLVSPGVHRLVVRIDGGRWIVPPGASLAVSEYGDVVGVIVAAPMPAASVASRSAHPAAADPIR